MGPVDSTVEYADVTDEQLAARVRLGDQVWLEELIRRFDSRIRKCAHRMVSPDEVEDAVQEIGLRITRSVTGYQGKSSLNTWIYSVARHTCVDVRRRRRVTYPLKADVAERSAYADPERSLDVAVIACRTAKALAALPPGQREVVLLRLGAGLSTEETAQRLGTTSDAVKARLRRARKRLRQDLDQVIQCPECGPGALSLQSLRAG
ncbi:MAG: RNA polymerase sigma factor [Acidimicrobiia bacterium]